MTIKINPENKGTLTKAVGKKGLEVKNLKKEISSAKKAGNVKMERKEVFALNAKTKFNHPGKRGK